MRTKTETSAEIIERCSRPCTGKLHRHGNYFYFACDNGEWLTFTLSTARQMFGEQMAELEDLSDQFPKRVVLRMEIAT